MTLYQIKPPHYILESIKNYIPNVYYEYWFDTMNYDLLKNNYILIRKDLDKWILKKFDINTKGEYILYQTSNKDEIKQKFYEATKKKFEYYLLQTCQITTINFEYNITENEYFTITYWDGNSHRGAYAISTLNDNPKENVLTAPPKYFTLLYNTNKKCFDLLSSDIKIYVNEYFDKNIISNIGDFKGYIKHKEFDDLFKKFVQD